MIKENNYSNEVNVHEKSKKTIKRKIIVVPKEKDIITKNIYDRSKFTNSNLLPLDVFDSPWLYESGRESEYIQDSEWLSMFDSGLDIGKWMLFYDKKLLNEAWLQVSKLYREGKMTGVRSIKCSTSYENPRASSYDAGIIIFDDQTKVSRFLQLPPKISEIHSILIK